MTLLGGLAWGDACAGTLLRIAAFNPLNDSTEQLVAKVGDRVLRIEALSSSNAGIRLVDLQQRRVRYVGVGGQVLFEAVDDYLSTVLALPARAAGAVPTEAERACGAVAADAMAQLKTIGTLLRYRPPAAASPADALFEVLEVRPEQRFGPETFFGLPDAPLGPPAGARSPTGEGRR